MEGGKRKKGQTESFKGKLGVKAKPLMRSQWVANFTSQEALTWINLTFSRKYQFTGSEIEAQ